MTSNVPGYAPAYVDRQTPEEMYLEAQRILSGAEPVPDFTLSDEPEPEAPLSAGARATVECLAAASAAEAERVRAAREAERAAKIQELADWHAIFDTGER
jgi:hypothetical protein